MLSDTMQQELNRQMNFEFAASHAYVAIAAYFEDRNLTGFARWFRMQSEEEREHALRFFDYLNDRRGRAVIGAVPEPQSEFASPLDAVEHAMSHEQHVTASIHSIYAQAVKEGDYPTQSMLKWFVDEQVEEEKNADELIQQLKLIGNDGPGLLYLDRALVTRGGEAEAGGAE